MAVTAGAGRDARPYQKGVRTGGPGVSAVVTPRVLRRLLFLEERANLVALDAKADDAAPRIDLLDRVGGYEPAAGEESRPHRQCIGLVRSRAVERALDAAEQASGCIRDGEPDGGAKVDLERGHQATVSLRRKENRSVM